MEISTLLLVVCILFLYYVSEEFPTDLPSNRNHIKSDIHDLAFPKYTSEELDANPVCFQELKQISERISHLEKINYEKFGPTDYAALKFGGEVVSVVSKTVAPATLSQAVLDMLY
ncbi:hypothetical protein ZHAS_00006548 [Anopheles sinensis]|uniref:Uncharacterized protein n=1 Tax=Anopheles sinensis TaxID=74873 RepID=A0A084VML4_ANOSI|nr:hypothetical protein ZHAS_00006548 [Anopheles sinensis]